MKKSDKKDRKDKSDIPAVDFTEQTPDILLGETEPDPLYKEALLSPEDRSKSEFSANTTARD